MKATVKGFTLIELMIVVAIVAILAAIALPAYQNYIGRSQVAEALLLLDSSKTSVTEFWTGTGHYPTAQASVLPTTPTSISGNYTKQIVLAANGVLTATMRGAGVSQCIANGTVRMTPPAAPASNQALVWTCSYSGITAACMPSTCH